MDNLSKHLMSGQNDYLLVDFGDGEKFERFGPYFLIRPEPCATKPSQLSKKEWQRNAHALFISDGKTSGSWKKLKPMNEDWTITWDLDGNNITLKLSLTKFKHVGLFPEQYENWKILIGYLNRYKKTSANALNLFAYTGGASLALAISGSNVTHVEALKQYNQWTRENMALNELSKIRVITDDAVKFVKKEIRRENLYNILILDPPAFGRGPKGEVWKLDRDIGNLLYDVRKIMDQEAYFIILNMYSLSSSHESVRSLVNEFFPDAKSRISHLVLKDSFGKELDTGIVAYVSNENID